MKEIHISFLLTIISSFTYLRICDKEDMMSSTPDIAANFNIKKNHTAAPAETLNFDGIDDFCFANINSPTEFTMEAWFKADPSAGGYRAVLVWQKTGPNHETSLEVNGAGLIRYGQYDYMHNRYQEVFSTTNVKDGNCHHVAGVVSGTQRLLYIDGLLEASFTINNNNHAAEDLTDLRIGNIQLTNGNMREHFRGDIDEVRIWDHARTCNEISSYMDCELTGNELGLIAYYDFNQGMNADNNPTETTLIDRTGNGYDCSLNNFALSGATSNWIASGCANPTNVCIPHWQFINIQGNNMGIANSDTTPSTTDDTDFGLTNSGTSSTKTYTIQNSGGQPLTISGITLTGDSEFVFGTGLVFPFNIAALETITFDVIFSPTSCVTNTYTSSISIDNNDCENGSYNFDIQGTGMVATPLTAMCQNITIALDSNGNATITPTDVDNGTTYNCNFTLAVTPSNFTCLNEGDNIVILTATDEMGNTSSCNATVTILNNIPLGFIR